MGRNFALTSAFKKANGIQNVFQVDGIPHVVARAALAPEAMQALRYAAGDEVVVLLSPADAQLHPPTPRRYREYSSQSKRSLSDETKVRNVSLAGKLIQPFFKDREVCDALRQITRLLDAGYSPRSFGLEYGNIDFESSHLVRGDADIELAGLNLADWATSVSIPKWMRISLSDCLDEVAQARAARAIVYHLERRTAWQREVLLSASSSLFIWPALTILGFLVSGTFGIISLILGFLIALRFTQLWGKGASSDIVKADVLRIVVMRLRAGSALGQAIRTGAMRLEYFEPTWGEPPDTREGLARMLQMRSVDNAVLISGDLAPACLRLARECERRDHARLAQMAIWAKAALGILLGSTALGLLS